MMKWIHMKFNKVKSNAKILYIYKEISAGE